ncbi:hypothetical protein BH10ACT8_BH10ACT8_11280 [soil metagenome]
MTAFQRIVTALEGENSTIRSRGHEKVSAQCPAHEDNQPSLSVTGIEGQVLLHCHGGCTTDDVLGALSLTKADLFDNPKGAAYRYDNGRAVVRTPDKRFSQRNTDNAPELYRLAKVRTAVAVGQPVYITEGEKDVHALEAEGVTATCSPMGAGKWSKVDPSPLYGADVVVIADQDEAGRRHAAEVIASLAGHARSLSLVAPKVGKDAADHIAAGYGVADFQAPSQRAKPVADGRKLVLTSAADIKPKRVRWLWDGRIALGTLSLASGPEGLGKSTAAFDRGARITRGELPGEYLGRPKSVLICASEDSWEHTIVPRLIAADADLHRVHRVEILSADDIHLGLSLPRDLREVEQAATQTDAAILILDPLLSRLGDDLDTHRDGDVRRALEPLVAVADRTGMAILGLIHHNKSGSADPLQLVMASKAFTAVARSVHTIIRDPDDESGDRRLFGTPKNNLGRTDLATLSFTVTSRAVDTDDGTAWTGQIVWGDEIEGSIADAMQRAGDTGDIRSATSEAADWLTDYLEMEGGRVLSSDAKQAARKAGHSDDSLKRARRKLRLAVEAVGFPRVTYWTAVPTQSEQLPRGDTPTALTAPTGQTTPTVGAVGAVGAVLGDRPHCDECTRRKAFGSGRCPEHTYNERTSA